MKKYVIIVITLGMASTFYAAEKAAQEQKLRNAAFGGKLAEVKALIDEHKVNVNAERCCYGYTALYWATKSGHADVVGALVERNAEVNKASGSGVTPLHLAAGKGYTTIARKLFDANADVDAKTKDGYKPLDVAVTCGQKGTIQLLKTHIEAQRSK